MQPNRDLEQFMNCPRQNALEKQYLTVGFSIEDLLSFLEWSSREEFAQSTRTAWKTHNAAGQNMDGTPAMKKTADSKKQNEKRERATYRERRRSSQLIEAFRRLKEILPNATKHTRKLDVLRMAAQYINDMTIILREYPKIERKNC